MNGQFSSIVVTNLDFDILVFMWLGDNSVMAQS